MSSGLFLTAGKKILICQDGVAGFLGRLLGLQTQAARACSYKQKCSLVRESPTHLPHLSPLIYAPFHPPASSLGNLFTEVIHSQVLNHKPAPPGQQAPVPPGPVCTQGLASHLNIKGELSQEGRSAAQKKMEK